MVTCSYYHTEGRLIGFMKHMLQTLRGRTRKWWKEVGKKTGKKKFRNANYAMHRKVETKQSTLSLLRLQETTWNEACRVGQTDFSWRPLLCVCGGGRRCTKFEVNRTNFKWVIIPASDLRHLLEVPLSLWHACSGSKSLCLIGSGFWPHWVTLSRLTMPTRPLPNSTSAVCPSASLTYAA